LETSNLTATNTAESQIIVPNKRRRSAKMTDEPIPSIDAEKASTLLTLVQALGTICLIIAGMMLYLLIDATEASSTAKLIGLVFTGIGSLAGLMGLWGSLPFSIIEISKMKIIPSLNNIFIIAAIICFILAAIIGVWDTRTYTDVGELSSSNLLNVVVFSFCLVCFIELGSTSNHFYSIKKFAKANKLKKENLNLNMLSGKYMLWFAVLFSIIFFYTWFVLDLQNMMIKMMGEGYNIPPFPSIEGLSHQFANSLILNSIYGVALSMGIIFIPFVILVSLVYGRKKKGLKEEE